MVRRYLAAMLLLATPALAAVELDGDSNGAIDVAKGGTNATTAAGARTALGVQPLDSDLTSIAGLATTAWGRGLLDDADAAAGRTSLGIAPADTLNVAGVDLGTGSTTTGLLKFYGNTKAFSFGIFSQGADGLGVGWRLPSTIPAATSLLTVDSSGYMAYLDPSAVPVTASGFNGNLTTTDDTLQKVAQKVDDLVISGAGDDLGSAAYGDVVALWTTCTGYLKSDGTCDTPSGSATYPSTAGVANWNGSAWGTSYTVGTAANNLVKLNASAQLPAVSAALLTNFPTLNQNTTGTAGGLSGTPNITVGTISAGAAGFGVDADGDVTAKSVTVTRTTSPTAIDLYEGTGGGDNKLTLTLSGNLAADATLNADQILVDGDIGSAVQGYDADLADLADGSLTGTKVGFADTDGLWTATNVQAALEELNDSINTGLPNGTGAKVHWSQLTGVPAGFADGTDAEGSGGGISHATSNGTYYASRNGAWAAFTSGNYTLAMTLAGNTAVTLPTSGTLIASGGAIGAATATTPSANDNDTSVATTAFVTGEVKKKYVSGTEADFYGTLLDPQAIYAVDGTNHAVTIANNVPAAFTITEINVSCDADPTTEITLTFKHKTAGAGYGTPTTIEAVTTTNGAATITTGFDDATIPAGTKLFMTLSDPDDALNECAWQIEGDWD